MNQQGLIYRREPYEIFILILTVLSLVNGAALLFWPDETWSSVIRNIDFLISFALLVDFVSLLYSAKNKSSYLIRGWGWADFIGSLPIPGFRLFRLIRAAAVSNRLHSEGVYGLRRGFRGRLSESTLLFVALGLILLLEIGWVLILMAEEDAPNANIVTGSDALWWAVVTVATVGYGDRFPVTNDGRIIGALIMMASVALVAVFTAYIAHSFLKRQEQERGDDEASQTDLRADVATLQRMVRELQESVDKLSGGQR
jgi:voltage-gated potassium channel